MLISCSSGSDEFIKTKQPACVFQLFTDMLITIFVSKPLFVFLFIVAVVLVEILMSY